jgi:DNA-binding NarL/FixJ family response regulator
MNQIRVVLADDHVMFRKGLTMMLAEKPRFEIVGEAGSGLELLDQLKRVTPDIVIMDISMPGLRGIEATKEIKSLRPEVKVLILTMHKDKDYLHKALLSGADGYLLKEDADTELFSAIETIRNNRIYISPILTRDLPDEWAKVCRGKIDLHEESLSNREREVLKLTAEGKSSREIAELLFISIRTVEHHRSKIMYKLGVKKAADLIRYAVQKGYV